MHARHPRAAVDTRTEAPVLPNTQRQDHPPTLWAERPFVLPRGRLVAIRLVRGTVQARFVEASSGDARWLPADQLLSASQATRWALTGFRR